MFLSLVVVAFPMSSAPQVHATTFTYTLKGAYNENGFFAGAINVTEYRSNNSSYTFTLSGTAVVTDSVAPIAFKFQLGYNNTRIYYIKANVTSETIYVIKPTQPYYSYAFTVINYLGVTSGYLESLININGTDRVVERWSIDVGNAALPFTMSWGQAYKMRIVCNKGVFYYPSFVAGATSASTLTVNIEMFPPASSDLRAVSVSAQRVNVTWIHSIYTDTAGNTTWIYMAISELGNASVIASTNVTASVLTWNWYGGDVNTNYYVRVIVSHVVRGTLTWVITVPYVSTPSNPWTTIDNIMGTNSLLPIKPSQLISIGIILLVFFAFSAFNVGVGLVVTNIVADFLTLLGWTGFDWSWLAISMIIAILVAISIQKDQESPY